MLNVRLLALAVAGVSALAAASGATITENFATNPFQNGWRIFGDTNLFQWDATNQNLRVTWDSAQPNSYFYLPLGTVLARDDDFSLAFDLRLEVIGPGPDTNKSSSFQIAIGFLNQDMAFQTNFIRGTGSESPDLAEFAYFWDSGFGATTWPTFVDTNSTFNFDTSTNTYAIFDLTPGDSYHVWMGFTASNQTVLATVTNFEQTAGVRISQPLNTNFGDFRLSAVSVSSYSDAGQDPMYAGSIFAQGTVDNIVVNVPPPPLQNPIGKLSHGVWEVQFSNRTNWLYILQRTTNFLNWSSVSPETPGASGSLLLSDTNTASAKAFYRVLARRP